MFNPTPRSAKIRGTSYKFIVKDSYAPTWETHESERDIRETWWHIQPGDIVADVGATYGSYSLAALAQGAAKCFCFSPDDEAVLLRENLAVNDWYDKAVVYEWGLWSKDGYLTTVNNRTVVHDDMPGFWKTRRQSPSFFVTTLDKIAAREKLSRLDWVKLDVEGAELEVLKGADNVLQTLRPRVLIENHLFISASIQKSCQELLTTKGYSCVGTIPYDFMVSHSFYQHQDDKRV